MLRSHTEPKLNALRFLDAALVCFSLPLAHAFRVHTLPGLGGVAGELPVIAPIEEFLWLWLIAFPTAPLLLDLFGHYRSAWSLKLGPILKAMFGILLLQSLAIVLTRENLSRLVLVIAMAFSTLALYARILLTRVLAMRAANDPAQRYILLLVTAPGQRRATESLVKSHPEGRLCDTAYFDLSSGSSAAFSQQLHTLSPTRVIVSADGVAFDRAQEIIRLCEIEGIEVCLLANFYQNSLARISFDDFGGTPVLRIRSAPEESWSLLAKSVLDRTAAAAALLVLAPLFAAIFALIQFTSPGPAIFLQKRGGRNGRPFTMFKFRTMVLEAEAQRDELEEQNEMQGPAFKLKDDPRVTPIGKWLRKHSLDELPQLWNVLRGEMSLVGPRPLPLYEVEKITDPAQRRRLSMKPGLTCLWQIAGRNHVSAFEDWVRLDLEYIDHWSLWLDLKILFQTIPAVLFGKGAS